MSTLAGIKKQPRLAQPAHPSRASAIAKKTGLFVFGILGTLLMLVLALPVLAAPFITGTPLVLSLLLIVIDAALVFVLLRFLSSPLMIAAVVTGWIVVSLVAIWFSQIFAYTPPIVDASGKPLPNSIAVLEKVKLNESEQWISIRGKDVNKPLMLFLAGGPGGSQLVTARHVLDELEEHFVVVNWEQPGAGKSFDAVPRSALTPERYIQDGHALVLYLRERFGEDKIYVLGESWGSALGIWLVQRYPELFHAFICT
jgi:hypothetical protein